MRPASPDRSRRPALSRRRFLALSAAATAGAGALSTPTWIGCAGAPPAESADPSTEPATPFAHGIASGDPLTDRVILWTRVTPPDPAPASVDVDWWIGTAPDPSTAVARGRVPASADRDYTVKIDALGLRPGTTYFYGFSIDGEASPLGRTRTLPQGRVDRLRLAVVSCSNRPQGYFTVYRHIAGRRDLDAVVHLGDYIYEYADGVYGDSRELGWEFEPPHEIVSLDDYRLRYASYRSDPDLQEIHRQHPMIAVWDDHELANNAWNEGAENHDSETEGAWADRRDAAVRAWHEWLPVRELPGEMTADRAGRSFRGLRFGDLADLLMLDTRLHGRDLQTERGDREAVKDPERQLLGRAQEAWLLDQLSTSVADGVTWRLLGQQVVMAPLALPDQAPNPDSWDGYPAARRRVLDHLASLGDRDVVVLTGDIHSSWALDVPRDPYSSEAYDPESGRGSLAVELVTPAVSSSPLGSFELAVELFARAQETRPHLQFIDLAHRGYLLVDLDRERVQGEWYFAEDVSRPDGAVRFAAALRSARGAAHLVAAPGPSEPRASAPPLAP